MLTSNPVFREIAKVQLMALDYLTQSLKGSSPQDSLLHDFRHYLQLPSGAPIKILNKQIESLQYTYKGLRDKPYDTLVYLLDEGQLDICIHILFHLEDFWLSEENAITPYMLQEAWSILFKAREKFHPEYNQVFNTKIIPLWKDPQKSPR